MTRIQACPARSSRAAAIWSRPRTARGEPTPAAPRNRTSFAKRAWRLSPSWSLSFSIERRLRALVGELGRVVRPCPGVAPMARIRAGSSPVVSLRFSDRPDPGEDPRLEVVLLSARRAASPGPRGPCRPPPGRHGSGRARGSARSSPAGRSRRGRTSSRPGRPCARRNPPPKIASKSSTRLTVTSGISLFPLPVMRGCAARRNPFDAVEATRRSPARRNHAPYRDACHPTHGWHRPADRPECSSRPARSPRAG